MYRSYALTLAAVTLRIYMPLSLALGIGFEDAYRVVSWLCWVPNLVFVEAWLLPRARLVAGGGERRHAVRSAEREVAKAAQRLARNASPWRH